MAKRDVPSKPVPSAAMSFWDTAASPDSTRAADVFDDGFDEDAYIRANPDVAVAVLSGAVTSARDHFLMWGRHEQRDLAFGVNDVRDQLISTQGVDGLQPQSSIHHSAEAVIVSRSGGVLVLGWIDDATRPMECITVVGPGWRVTFDAVALTRRTRADVAEALGRDGAYGFGYLGFVFGEREIQAVGPCELQFRFRDGGAMAATFETRGVDDVELRAILLSHIANAPGLGGVTINAVASLARGLGDHIVRFNHAITRPLTRGAYSARFGGPRRKHRGTIVVCLYGRAEYHFIQNALFAMNDGIDNYEFIFVSNSPELAEILLGNAKKCHRIHGLDQTIILLPGNAGFGAANNVAARAAERERLLIVNPDVFPKDPSWARKHLELIQARPRHETQLFGVPLYYDDGSLMHGGMFFEMDTKVSFDRNRTALSQLLRVEHYGKGAPAESPQYTTPRPVPAVTGAFISVARPWFERLGGFTEDYVFGHYEDADLCLKSLKGGNPAWLQDLRMWHLEGKGSIRLPVHEGGSVVNRWLFSSQWGEAVNDGLLGPEPTHPLLKLPAP